MSIHAIFCAEKHGCGGVGHGFHMIFHGNPGFQTRVFGMSSMNNRFFLRRDLVLFSPGFDRLRTVKVCI